MNFIIEKKFFLLCKDFSANKSLPYDSAMYQKMQNGNIIFGGERIFVIFI